MTMQGFVDYIFKHMNDTEAVMKHVCGKIRKNEKKVGQLEFVVAGLVISTAMKSISDSMRDREIAKLKKEVAELKQKGD